jgi:hypothetical protein
MVDKLLLIVDPSSNLFFIIEKSFCVDGLGVDSQ